MNEIMFGKLEQAQIALSRLSNQYGLESIDFDRGNRLALESAISRDIDTANISTEASAILGSFLTELKDLGGWFVDVFKELVGTRILEYKESRDIIQRGMDEFKKSDLSLSMNCSPYFKPVGSDYKSVYALTEAICKNSKNLARTATETRKICNELLDMAYAMSTSFKDDGRGFATKIPKITKEIENLVSTSHPRKERTGEAINTYFATYPANFNFGVSIRADEISNKYYVDREKVNHGSGVKIALNMNKKEREELSNLILKNDFTSDLKDAAESFKVLANRLVKYEIQFGVMGTWLLEKFGVLFAVAIKMAMNLASAIGRHCKYAFEYLLEVGSALGRGYRRM